MSNKRVVIVEFMGSHSECIYSVIEAYKHKGFDVHLVTSNREIKTIGYLDKEVASWQHINWTDSQFGLLLRIFQMRLMIGRIKPQEIFFNTAQGTMVRTLLQLLPKGITKKGFIHNTRKLSGSSTQKTISKYLSKYLVLSEFQKTDASSKTTTPVDVFYPISFYRNKEVKQDSELTLCVVGAMEYKKKDIGFLLDKLDLLVQSRIRIIFAGKIDPNKPELQPLLAKISAIPTVEYYTEFIPDSKLFELIEKSHVVWPLIHPGKQEGNQYMSTQTSGSINMAFGFKKPIFLHKDFIMGDHLSIASIPYSLETFENDLKKLQEVSIIEGRQEKINSSSLFQTSTYFENI